MCLTVWVWPLVSPFLQDFRRERLQKFVWPVSMVCSSDARFIQAIINTRPVVCSWMMAGMRPSELNFSWS